MTRDEAVSIEFKLAREWPYFVHITDADIQRAAENTIDGYVALGMLKLDEPKSASQRIDREIARRLNSGFGQLPTPAFNSDFLEAVIAGAGLKIVEK